jgi:hypothetical protein
MQRERSNVILSVAILSLSKGSEVEGRKDRGNHC